MNFQKSGCKTAFNLPYTSESIPQNYLKNFPQNGCKNASILPYTSENKLIHKKICKGNAEEYLITQYLSSMAQYNGFDGIRFRSSLVYEGTNYVIFDNENCDVVCSKMYIIPAVQYTLQPILNDDYT